MNPADRHRVDETNGALHQLSQQIAHVDARLTELERLVRDLVHRFDRDYTPNRGK
jgi:hypothetical protein